MLNNEIVHFVHDFIHYSGFVPSDKTDVVEKNGRFFSNPTVFSVRERIF